MNSKDLGRAILMVVLIGALILLAVDKRVMADEGSSAQIVSDEPPGTGLSEGQPEIQSEIRAPAAGGSGIYTSSGLEFWPYMSSTTFARYGVGICNTSVDSRNFETQLHLPHGVTIQQVVVYFYDNDSTNNLYADFNYHLIRIGAPIFSLSSIHLELPPKYAILVPHLLHRITT